MFMQEEPKYFEEKKKLYKCHLSKKKPKGNVRINVILMCVQVSIVEAEKQ